MQVKFLGCGDAFGSGGRLNTCFLVNRGDASLLIDCGASGQRPLVPRLKAEHMAAPTNAANVKKVLANPEPSTHGTSRTN